MKLDTRDLNSDMFRYIRPIYGRQGMTLVDGAWTVTDIWELA